MSVGIFYFLFLFVLFESSVFNTIFVLCFGEKNLVEQIGLEEKGKAG